LDFGLSGQLDKFRWNASYSFIHATYDTDLDLLSNSNSSADSDSYVGSDSSVAANTDKSVIHVKRGNYLPSIPKHQLKLRAQYQMNEDWSVGANLIAYANQFVMGNENNQHQANTAGCLNSGALTGNDQACGSGKLSGYTIVNLDSKYKIGNGWQAFAKVINVFDQDYNVAGRLGETGFTSSGSFVGPDDQIKSLGLIPGAPRAGWIGVRYEFGGAPEAK
jgi:outer membrane receptor protein involved in Fe transport